MGGGLVSPGELREVLTPGLFLLIVHTRLPYPKRDPIDFAKFGQAIFLEDDFSPIVEDKVWPALLLLSKVGLDNMPDLSEYLPPPTDPSYPEQCLGLELLLDHCPRLMFVGVDERWTYGYFSQVSKRLANKWYALPEAQRPDSWERWQQGAGLDYWIGARFWLGTPFVHSESRETHKIAVKFTATTRSVVESVTGQKNPYRSKREEILADLYGFPRVYKQGPPQGDGVTRESWTFWMGMLMDIHEPIIARYGRYPYLNAIRGKESTEGEKDWANKTNHYGAAKKDVAKKIKEDVKLGRWRPLGEDS
ncbi:hypothetical protein GQ53DRAFT_852573 [Thozetella sp. PMI_491]|nr:hypothetical protein GQ53DRAFT_852573 [Thozetella sp. PMI_491]